MGAIAIGFDVVFAEPDRLSPDRIAEDNAVAAGGLSRRTS